MFSAITIPVLRKNKNYMPHKDIVYKAALEEIYLACLRDGKVNKRNFKVLQAMCKKSDRIIAKKKYKQHIEYLARAFLISNVDRIGFIEAKHKWIREIHAKGLDVFPSGSQFFLFNRYCHDKSGPLQNSEDSKEFKISNQGKRNIHDSIERLDSILMKIYTHITVDEDECKFMFQKIESKHWKVDMTSNGMIKNETSREISKKLLKKWHDSNNNLLNQGGSLTRSEHSDGSDIETCKGTLHKFQSLYVNSITPPNLYGDQNYLKEKDFFDLRNPQSDTQTVPTSDHMNNIMACGGITEPEATTIIRYRYTLSPVLYPRDCNIYQERFLVLFEKIKRIKQIFFDGTYAIDQELGCVRDWYSNLTWIHHCSIGGDFIC